MPFASLKDLLPYAVRQAGVDVPVDAAKVVTVAQTVAARIFSPEQLRYIQPAAFVGGTLRVDLTSPSAMHAMRMYARPWMEAINAELGRKMVTELTARRKGF